MAYLTGTEKEEVLNDLFKRTTFADICERETQVEDDCPLLIKDCAGAGGAVTYNDLRRETLSSFIEVGEYRLTWLGNSDPTKEQFFQALVWKMEREAV